jgi:hypothetical protein
VESDFHGIGGFNQGKGLSILHCSR